MNGIEVTRQIRSLGDDTPIIILTAYDWSEIEAEARAAGVNAFCAKPIFMSDIRDTLMTAIGQKQDRTNDDILPAVSSDFRGRSILLVEDNELNSEIAIAILNEYGFRFIQQKMEQRQWRKSGIQHQAIMSLYLWIFRCL